MNCLELTKLLQDYCNAIEARVSANYGDRVFDVGRLERHGNLREKEEAAREEIVKAFFFYKNQLGKN